MIRLRTKGSMGHFTGSFEANRRNMEVIPNRVSGVGQGIDRVALEPERLRCRRDVRGGDGQVAPLDFDDFALLKSSQCNQPEETDPCPTGECQAARLSGNRPLGGKNRRFS